jgi:hypothetical protein|tara:strand:- start:4625 stop:4810 length:186 start_codon:yes stop_codon:yes gene_type:complete
MRTIKTNTGFKGVTKRADRNNKYEAWINTSNVKNKVHVGTFSKLKDAVNARMTKLENLIKL